MYQSILVPLDRTSFAERALPLAAGLARRAHARLDLCEVHTLYALDEPFADWAPYDSACDAECRRKEQLYLEATARWVSATTPVATSVGVLDGSVALPATVADSILERARAGKADLIVMATHGPGPLSGFGIGSIADEIIRRADVPVLLVRPAKTDADVIPEPTPENIIIPLDGSPLAEQALRPATDLASLLGARCVLVRVVAPGAAEAAAAEGYLGRVAERLAAQGLCVTTRVVVAPRPAEAILAQAAVQASPLIAVATHGRGGFGRLLLGSVTANLVRAAAAPVLVYRPDGAG